MVSRRDLILTGALGSTIGRSEAFAQQGVSTERDRGIEDVLRQIRTALRELYTIPPLKEIADIRDRQRTHLKINQKLPEYIDVGVAVWERLYDWHLQNRVPLKIGRGPDGHAEMEIMLTTLVLRADVPDSQIGVPYDR